MADTMDLWIRTEPDELRELLRRIDGLVLNDSEAKLLTGEDNLVRAGNLVREMGRVCGSEGEQADVSARRDFTCAAIPTG